jgi:hypothetical protein
MKVYYVEKEATKFKYFSTLRGHFRFFFRFCNVTRNAECASLAYHFCKLISVAPRFLIEKKLSFYKRLGFKVYYLLK